ncbi:MAG: hypothetical protein AB7G93_16615 [Bdellovibrionales bacterium]
MKFYHKGDRERAHYHAVAREYTIVASGRFRMADVHLGAGDIMELAPGDVADFECLEDGVTFVIKTPSVSDDKILVADPE